MRHNLKAVFDDRGKAQHALDELLAAGYARADIDLASIPGARLGSDDAPALGWPERPGTSTAHLLSRFLGRADSRPVAPDSHVLTLSIDSAQEAVRAASLVAGFVHPCGEGGGASLSGGREDRAYVAHRRTAEPGALQFSARDVHHYFGTRDAGDTSTIGTTYREPMLPAGLWPENTGVACGPSTPESAPAPRHPGKPTAWENFVEALKHGWDRIGSGRDLDEASYRLHHAHTYPGTNYNDLAPVYRYGHNVRRRAMFQGRDWEDVEVELRSEWERGHREGKPATWDEMKAALHHGWDRM